MIINREIKWFSILFFCLCNLLMLIVSGTALDMRFHITYIPLFLLISLNSMEKRKFNFIYSVYFVGLLLIILVYNSRTL